MSSIHDYSDIIDLPRPELKWHQRMPTADRAAQFAPFAALTGYSSVIEEIGRTTEERVILDEREKERINRTLQILQSKIGRHPQVKITRFVTDSKKEGGSYQTIKGRLSKIVTAEKLLILTDGSKVKFDDIIKIE